MAICNLFNKFHKNDGSFIMFSQYAEDLNKSATQGQVYRVVPSKYIALNIDYSKITVPEGEDANEYIPRLFQNYYENACAFLRTQSEYDWTPDDAKDLFWEFLSDKGFIELDDYENGSAIIIKEGMFVGDINIQSFNQHDGMGYGEIYCYIGEDDVHSTVSFDMTPNTKKSILYNKDYVMGYDDSDYKEDTLMCKLNVDADTNYGSKYIYNIESTINLSDESDKELSFNTIIILYDTYTNQEDGSLVNLNSDMPLGIYFSGIIGDDKQMTNIISKFIKNGDIYGSGTSYGLKICTRFTVIPREKVDNIKPINITADIDSYYSAYSMVLGQMSEVLEKVNKMTEGNIAGLNQFKQFCSGFKTNMTNVPYIKNVNDKNYWFVNGKNMGVAATDDADIDVDTELNIFSENPVQNKVITNEINDINTDLGTAMTDIEKLNDKVFPLTLNASGGGLYKKGTYEDITITWSLTRGEEKVVPDSATINDSPISFNEPTVFESVSDTTSYVLKVTKSDKVLSKTLTATFIASRYYGFSNKSDANNFSDFNDLIEQPLSTSPAGTYTLVNDNAENYLWLCVPNGMTINKVTSSGFDVPMESPTSISISTDTYNCYRSSSKINPTTMEIVIK